MIILRQRVFALSDYNGLEEVEAKELRARKDRAAAKVLELRKIINKKFNNATDKEKAIKDRNAEYNWVLGRARENTQASKFDIVFKNEDHKNKVDKEIEKKRQKLAELERNEVKPDTGDYLTDLDVISEYNNNKHALKQDIEQLEESKKNVPGFITNKDKTNIKKLEQDSFEKDAEKFIKDTVDNKEKGAKVASEILDKPVSVDPEPTKITVKPPKAKSKHTPTNEKGKKAMESAKSFKLDKAIEYIKNNPKKTAGYATLGVGTIALGANGVSKSIKKKKERKSNLIAMKRINEE